jgi:hypothetical protein
MIAAGLDASTMTYKSANYRGFTLHENYGSWRLEFGDKSVEIFYCPFCGKQLNKWDWAATRRKENFEKYF